MSLVIQSLLETDLDETDAVVKAAYNLPVSRREALRRFLALQPDGAFVVKNNSLIVGFGAVTSYQAFAYIGLMSVHPSMQKRGVGQLIMEQLLTWLEARRCPTVLLDATPAGTPLYERYGFQQESRTLVLNRTQSVSFSPPSAGEISFARIEDIPELAAFDTPCFGANREALLRLYLTENSRRVLLKRDAAGKLMGYLIAQPRTLGPWVALDEETGEHLLAQALRLPFEQGPGIFVSADNEQALRLFARYGFTEERGLSHMSRGKKLQRARGTLLYGQASLGLG